MKNFCVSRETEYRGCLLGGAVGDALGVPVEFPDEADIFNKYGRRGITNFTKLSGTGKFTDDTQMTLFTTAGLLACDVNETITTIREENTQEENTNVFTASSVDLHRETFLLKYFPGTTQNAAAISKIAAAS